MKRNRITWIASYPKSGSTWVRGFLSAYLNHGELDINTFRFIDVDDITEYFYHIVSPRSLAVYTPNEMTQLRGAALMHMNTLLDYPFIKTHSLNAEIDGVTMIPNCLTDRAIYLLRDPRDVVISIAHQLDWSIDEAIGFINNPRQLIHKNKDCTGLFNYVGMWAQHVVSWGDEKAFRIGLVRYEDLIEKPHASFKTILTFLDWEYEEERFNKSIIAASFSSMQKQELENSFRENRGKAKFFREGKAGAWRNILTEEQLAKIEDQNFDIMERMNYKLETMGKVA